MRELTFEIQRINEREQLEREKFVLKVENTLLRFDSQPTPRKERKKLQVAYNFGHTSGLSLYSRFYRILKTKELY